MVLQALRSLRFEAWALRVSRAGRAHLQQQKTQQLRVHLGCGSDVRAGWLNIDLLRDHPAKGPDYVNFDLRRGLPLPAGSCSFIYSSHVIEHFTWPTVRRLFRDCYNALADGGIMRCSLPDFRRAFQAYVSSDMAYFEPLSEYCGQRATMIEYMDYIVHQGGEHKSLHDFDSFRISLAAAGFRSAEQAEFDPAVDPGDAMRRRYSMYVTARK